MANIPGASNVLPGVITDVVTQTRAVSVPGGIRIAALIGEGSRTEVIVSSALGGGSDGFNPTYTSASGSDGRHFLLKFAPVISNRTTLFKNGIPLVGLEAQIDTDPFNNQYDYRIDIATGRIELQRAHLQDLGGSFYSISTSNVGLGTISSLTLTDVNAPTETWTIKCISVQRNNLNQPIAETARFIAMGTVSGQKLDANGNPVVWVSNGQTVTNGILSFAINETGAPSSTSPFREGDTFTIKVSSGVLGKNDTLTATYIGVADINDPVFFTTMEDVALKHGNPSLDNTLSLGSSLAFSNSPPGVLCMQAAPALPRRTSYVLDEDVNADAPDDDEFIFPLPPGVTPDFDSNIHFFVTNPTTGVETQILPNKQEFYTLDSGPLDLVTHTFIFDDVIAPAGHSYFYTVVNKLESINFGEDGYIGRDLGNDGYGQFSSSVSFDSSYVGKGLKIIDSVNSANLGLFKVISVTNGKLNFGAVGGTFSTPLTFNPTYLSDFLTETSGLAFKVIDPVTGLQVDGYAGTDGYVVSTGAATGDGYFKSLGTIDFSTVPGITGLKLRVTGSAVTSNSAPVGNDGLYDILSVSGTGINIKKELVNESNLEYEILDPDITSNYVVVNHNVVPDGNSLRVTIIDERDSTFFDSGWTTALETLETVECDILVTLPKQTISVIFHNALNHCLTMSTNRNKKERVLFLGAITGLTPDNVLGNTAAAVEDIGVLEGIQGDSVAEILAGSTEDLTNYSVEDGFGSTFRAVYFYPDQIVAAVGGENTFLDGFYIAAAAAGFLSGVANVSIPLTNKVISGFNILKNKQFPQTVLENLASAGITVLQPVAGGGRVLWGKTTTQSGFPEEEEISIVFIRDRIAKSLREGFAGFIGIPEDPDIIPMFTARATGLLKSFISQRLITDYANLQVKRDDVDPRQWNISVQVQPVYPVNWIYIRVGVGLI